MRSNQVKSATRVLDLLEHLSRPSAAKRVTDIAAALEIPQSSASMLLSTLEARGYIERLGREYRIAKRYAEFGWVAGELGVLIRASKPYMAELTEQTGESTFLGVLTSSREMEYVEKVTSTSPLRYDADLGSRAAYATTNGLVLLAALSDDELDTYISTTHFKALTPATITNGQQLLEEIRRVRLQGYATLIDSHVIGAAGVSAGVRNQKGETVAAICVIAPVSRFKPKAQAITDALRNTCNEIGADLPS
ncbi:IclR family transcriptional regulator [Parapusillimonas sp. JC17]|uniref:IclR family transcriptional regulator n=1 Tax=Parapusillimonas sp. JC17 TaxID=3445768 RepID=UPI003F9FC386